MLQVQFPVIVRLMVLKSNMSASSNRPDGSLNDPPCSFNARPVLSTLGLNFEPLQMMFGNIEARAHRLQHLSAQRRRSGVIAFIHGGDDRHLPFYALLSLAHMTPRHFQYRLGTLDHWPAALRIGNVNNASKPPSRSRRGLGAVKLHQSQLSVLTLLHLRLRFPARTFGFIAGNGSSWASAAEGYVCSRLNGAKARTMLEYHCHMLDEHGEILFPADLIAEALDAAIREAFRILHTNNEGAAPSERVCGFEVWREPSAC
jgi:hypothetical protein